MSNAIIIEQRPLLRLGIKYCLEKKYEELEVTDLSTMEDYYLRPNLKADDFILLGIEGSFERYQKVHNLKKSNTKARIIVYDSEAKAEHGIHYLKSGAQGYLSNISDLELLWNCIETVMAGKFYIEPMHMDSFVNGIIGGKSAIKESFKISNQRLTTRQSEIAKLLAQGISTSGIARKLGLSPSTVSTVKGTIYAKLKVNTIIDLSKAVAEN